MHTDKIRGPVLFEYGFRPFFLLAGMMAILSVGVWITLYSGWQIPGLELQTPWWHAHEMVFGFVAAAATGFLLTAIPNWTGIPPVRGSRLISMSLLWLVARLVGFIPGPMAVGVAAVVDLLFFVLLALLVSIPMWRHGTRFHRWPPVVLMSLLAVGDGMVHAEQLGWLEDGARIGVYLGLDTVLLLGVIIGGQLMPRFTHGAYVAQGITLRIKPHPRIEAATLFSMLLVVVTDLIAIDHPVNGWAVLLTATACGIRLTGWYPFQNAVPPILWVLQLGYLWLVAGLALRGLAQLTGFISIATAIHAVTMGAMGTLILGIMTRVTLAHTGRPLETPRSVVVGYGLLSLASLVRVGMVPFEPMLGVQLSGWLWIAGFLPFVIFTVPILIRPRIDGQPG